MNTQTIRPKKEEDGEKAKSMSTKPPLTERIMKKAAAAVLTVGIALSPAACSLMTDFTLPKELDGGTDADAEVVDGDVSDADTIADSNVADADNEIVDGDMADSDVSDSDVTDADNEIVDGDVADADEGIVDADVADSDTLDGDVGDADTIADSDVVDGDMTDGDVSDSDVADADGPLCSDIFDEVVTEETFDKGTGREVGGYMITYVSQTTGGLTLDIDCGSDSSSIASGESLTTLVGHTVEVPDDGKRIRITVHSRNTFDATMSVAVEPL